MPPSVVTTTRAASSPAREPEMDEFLKDPDVLDVKPVSTKELAKELAAAADISPGDAYEVIKFTCELVAAHLIAGRSVVLPKLGRFVIRSMPSRVVRNPRTGETRIRKPTQRAKFKMAPSLHLAVMGKVEHE